MEQSDLLQFCVTALEHLGIQYFVTGSTASIIYGEPRFTNDIDIVASIESPKVSKLCEAFPLPDFYVSVDAVRDAVQTHGQFNVLHPASGLKVDFIVPANTAYDRGRFLRSRRIEAAPGCNANFASLEDVILMKLRYYREGGSDKHLRDIAGIVKISGDRLDGGYLDTWVDRLGLTAEWTAVQSSIPRKS